MPEEFSRTTARKRITLPDGNSVDVPVITQISFIDTADRSQEIQFTIDNSAKSDRIVRVDAIQGLPVERIVQWKTIDATDRGQESWISVDNETLGGSPPPYFITHLRTHIVRYNGSGGSWIESELIDEIAFLDGPDRGQETVYTLNNPQTDIEAQADPGDPDISDTSNGVDPPWRTDPFQNLVKFSSDETLLVIEIWMGVLEQHGTNFGAGDAPPSSTANVGGFADSAVINIRYSPHDSPSTIFSGWPSTTTLAIPVDADTVPGPGNISSHPIISGPCNATAKVNWVAGGPIPDLGSTHLNELYSNYKDTKIFSYDCYTDTMTGGFFNPTSGEDTLFRNANGVLELRQTKDLDLTAATITQNPGTTSEVVYEVIGTFCDHPNEYGCGFVHNGYEFMFPDTPAWPRPPFPDYPFFMLGFGVVKVLLRIQQSA